MLLTKMEMITRHIFLIFFLQSFIFDIYSKEVFNDITGEISKYSMVNPQFIQRKSRSVNTPIENNEDEMLSFSIHINNKQHHIHLKKNRDFLHPNFLQQSEKDNSSYPRQHGDCHYHGEVEGQENSLVALSTCSGLRGVIILGNETFGLEPVPQSSTNDHRLYLLKDSQSEEVTCGVVEEAGSTPRHENFEPGRSLTSLLRKKRNLPQTSYVELVLVVDKARYDFKERNESAIREEMIEMANLLDGFYKPLNIRIVLIGLEIFKESDPFSVEGSAGDVLGRFVKWRKSTLLPKVRHDVGQLIVGRSSAFPGSVLGMAFVGTICSVASSGGVSVFSENKLAFTSTVVAHEMGHNLGMNHDRDSCKCDGKNCIMAASAGGSTSFSQCSGQDFETLVIRGGGACLRNPPNPSDVMGTAECGNGRLDEGEECDCGKPEECKTKCCDAATCKFTAGSKCSEGACCSNCQIKVSGTMCRKSVNTCDLPEYCDGRGAFCPEDYYRMDGLPCENDAAYCFEGRCQTYDYQCKHLFAPDPARKADDVCFEHANTAGTSFGNCGITSAGVPIKCAVQDAMCGKLQCTDVDVNNPPPGAQVSIQIVQGAKCVNAHFNLGPDVLDPAYVNTGSPCSPGKACLDFHCVNASALLPLLDCSATKTCNNRGVCNDQGNCHCNDGWAPPRCATAGRGGSINSGPAMIDHSLRNGLLIFFLLVVPVLVVVILVLLYVFRRESLDPCLKRNVKNNRSANPQTDENLPPVLVTQPPAQTSRDKLGNPAANSTPVSGFRYGEIDYWNADTNEDPPKASPAQGPGVPKPIPAKQPPV